MRHLQFGPGVENDWRRIRGLCYMTEKKVIREERLVDGAWGLD